VICGLSFEAVFVMVVNVFFRPCL